MHFTCYDIDYLPFFAGSPSTEEKDSDLSQRKEQFLITSDELRSLNLPDDLSNDESCNASLFSYSSEPSDEYSPVSSDIFNSQQQNTHVYNSFLKPGAAFSGFQESGRHQYKVEVNIRSMDLHNSSISGLLTIHNLTETHPVLTTYFDGEIIGPKHSFVTRNQEWDSSVRNDIQHWARFSSWRDLDLDLLHDQKNTHWYQNHAHSSDHIYMRWKEKFLYPNNDVSNIKGASFAGFYYVCFNVKTGSITGLYFHKFTDRFQQLNLTHVPDMGVCQTYELC